jgi:hypothetical protein
MTPKTSRIGSWIVLAILVLLLMLSIVFAFIGWGSADVATGQPMSTGGYVAMAFGIIVTLALGVGLMALVFYSNREGHD